MEYKGKREIKVDDVTNAFFARAASAILDDLEIDFDLAEIVYGDEEEIDLDIDGEDWVICYDQDEDGFHFHLLDTASLPRHEIFSESMSFFEVHAVAHVASLQGAFENLCSGALGRQYR